MLHGFPVRPSQGCTHCPKRRRFASVDVSANPRPSERDVGERDVGERGANAAKSAGHLPALHCRRIAFPTSPAGKGSLTNTRSTPKDSPTAARVWLGVWIKMSLRRVQRRHCREELGVQSVVFRLDGNAWLIPFE